MSTEHPNDAFTNQDVIKHLTTSEFRELSNLKEIRRSLAAVVHYLENREGAIFAAARIRIADAGGAGE